MSVFRRFVQATALPAFVALVGCGSGGDSANDAGKSVVKGKLVEKGKPFVLDQSRMKLPPGATGLPPGVEASSLLQITFTPTEGGEVALVTSDPKSGTFEVTGADGKGIKPGRYRISVVASYGPGQPDYFGGKFSPEKTKILRDVKAGDEITIDVAKADG